MEQIFHAVQPMAAQRNIELSLNMPDIFPSILVDEGRMLQVLKNLVDNTLRYTPEGGWMELSVRSDEQVHLRVAARVQESTRKIGFLSSIVFIGLIKHARPSRDTPE